MNKPPVQWKMSPKFTEDRCAATPAPGILGIVLHEVDVPLQTLDSQMREDCYPEDRGFHTSFHYGVSGTYISQYVLDKDQSWTYPMDEDTSGWPIVVPVGEDPDCVTLDIAVVTGVTTAGMGCWHPDNAYGQQTLRYLANLICALMTEYDLTIDMVFRHRQELRDMPWDFLIECVESCLSTPIDPIIPPDADAICDVLVSLPEGGPATADTLLVGADCLTYTLGDVGGGPVLQDCTGAALTDDPLQIPTCDQVSSIENSLTIVEGDITNIENQIGNIRDCTGTSLDLSAPVQLAECSDLIDVDNIRDCSDTPIDLTVPQQFVTCPTVTCPTETSAVQMGVIPSSGNLGLVRTRQSLPYRDAGDGDSLIPATDGTIGLDASAGDVTFDLGSISTAACVPFDFYIKRMDDSSSGNIVTISSAALIDNVGSITLSGPGPFSANRSEAVHVQWTGATWIIL